MRIKTENGYWIYKNFHKVKFFKLRRHAKNYMEDNFWTSPEYTIRKGTQSHKI